MERRVMTKPDDWTDEEILVALHMRDAEGLTMQQIGTAFGRSKNAVGGRLHRIPEPTDDAIKPENRHGAMGPRWGLNVLRGLR